MIRKYGLGNDPEVFCLADGEIISPALLELFSGLQYIRQDEQEKHPVYIENEEFYWMQDGAAFETGNKKPFFDPTIGYKNSQNALQTLREFLSDYKFNDQELEVVAKPVAPINPERYIRLLDITKVYQGFIFGCDKDWDGIIPDYKCVTIDVTTHPWRYGGGHLHFSTEGEESLYKYANIAVKFLALTAGNFCVIHTKYRQEDIQRVSTYGRPGRYRPQKYPGGWFGVEYRSPSNSWLNYSEDEFCEMYEWGIRGLEFFFDGRNDLIDKFLPQTINAITNSNPELAAEILDNLISSL